MTVFRRAGTLACLFAAMALNLGGVAHANGQPRPSFQQLMGESTIVVIGTVLSVHSGGVTGQGWAMISVQHSLKGTPRQVVTVTTTSPVAELDPRCCETGATYIMFLRLPTPESTAFIPVRGSYGIVWLGAGFPAGTAGPY